MLVVEFIVTDDLMQGPQAAMCDVLRLINDVSAAMGRSDPPVGWRIWQEQPSSADDSRPGVLDSPPDIAVFAGWVAGSGSKLRQLADRDLAGAARMRRAHEAGRPVLAVHSGACMLARAGLLRDREAAFPWSYLGAMLALEPRLHVASPGPWCESGGIWTVADPSRAAEVGFEMLARYGLGDLAMAVREVMLPDERRQRTLPNLAARLRPVRPVGQIEKARRHIEEHFHETISLEVLADVASMSVRSLLRMFKLHFGMTPVQMVHRTRIASARMLLQTSLMQIDQVSELCGWHSTAMMRRVFKRETGMTPDEYRRRFNLMPPRVLQSSR